MNYGIQVSTSGVLSSLYRQDVLTNNLANLETAGFKPDIPVMRQRDPVRAEDGLGFMASNLLIERLGAGVVPAPNRVSFAQGRVEMTGNDFDLAIEGKGFFAVRTSDPSGNEITALTRDGRFTRNSSGQLVMAASGLAVLGASGHPIRLSPDAPVEIDAGGAIRQDGRVVDRLRFVEAADLRGLKKLGEGLFGTDPRFEADFKPASGRVHQGAIEGSAVNEIRAMMQIQAAARAVGTNIGMIRYQDQMMERAINTFGRTG